MSRRLSPVLVSIAAAALAAGSLAACSSSPTAANSAPSSSTIESTPTTSPEPSTEASSATPSVDQSTDATSPTPTSPGLAIAPTSVDFKDSQGYTYTLGMDWSADPAKTDVGSEPPGQTDIALTVTHFSGTFTNTTTGGRAFPDQLPVASVVGLYPASSVVCQHSDNADVSAQLTGHNELWEAKGGCAVYLYGFLGSPAPGGAFYPNGKDAGVPNGQLISFTVDDTQFSNADTPPSLHISGVDETRATAWVKALNTPIAIGVAAGPNDMPQGSTPKCVYTDAGASYLTTNIAIYTSISGGTPAGCS